MTSSWSKILGEAAGQRMAINAPKIFLDYIFTTHRSVQYGEDRSAITAKHKTEFENSVVARYGQADIPWDVLLTVSWNPTSALNLPAMYIWYMLNQQ